MYTASTTTTRKAPIAVGSVDLNNPPSYVTIHRRIRKVPKSQKLQGDQRCRPGTTNHQRNEGEDEELFSNSHHVDGADFRGHKNSGGRIRARLCASVGDLSQSRSLLSRINLKSFLDSNWSISNSSIQPVSIASSCWRRQKSPSQRKATGQSSSENCQRKGTSQSSATNSPSTEAQTRKIVSNSGKQENPKPKLTTPSMPSGAMSFMSRVFSSSADKQRRRQAHQQQKLQFKRSLEENINNNDTTDNGLIRRCPSPPDHYQVPSSVINDGTAYRTASLGRYNKLKKHFSPPVLVYQDGMDESIGECIMHGSNDNPKMDTVSTLPASMKTLSTRLQCKQQDRQNGRCDENLSVHVSSTEGDVYNSNSISQIITDDTLLDATDPPAMPQGQNYDDESHKKARSLIITTLGSPVRPKKQPSSISIPSNAGSIGKSGGGGGGGGGLAGKITRGIQEFASSSERLMSWKAKLKKTKVDNPEVTTANGHSSPEAQNEKNFLAKSDPLPRAPKYVYKTSSIDSSYDMAMGAYENCGQEEAPLWIMDERRVSNAKPEGFYVGLTLINNEALQAVTVMAKEQAGLNFSKKDDGSTGGTGKRIEDTGSGIHYEEIDTNGRVKENKCSIRNMDSHHQSDHGIYNLHQLVAHSVPFKPVSGEEESEVQQEQSTETTLPPPTRITPYSGVPQGKDGEIVRPLAFRPVAPSNPLRAQSIPKQHHTNELVVVSPMKQTHIAPYRHVSPSTDFVRSTYDSTVIHQHPSQTKNPVHTPSINPAHTLSAFTPPATRRQLHHVTITPSSTTKVQYEGSIEEDRLVRPRDAHSMTPGRALPTQQLTRYPECEDSESPWKIGRPAVPQTRPPPISYQDYCRQAQKQLDQRVKVNIKNDNEQNEYDTIGDPNPSPGQQHFFNGNRSSQVSNDGSKKNLPPQPPTRTTTSLTTGHHHLSLYQQQASVEGGAGGSQNYGSLGSGNSSGIHVTPSPSDSGVAELETAVKEKDNEFQTALKEKENELVHLRQTMEHNEQAIVRVYQEKEKRWQEKLREWAARLEHAVSIEQRFLSEVDHLNTERMELHNQVQNLLAEKQGLQRKCKELESELFSAKSRLDDRHQTNWVVCKQCGCVLTFETRAGAASTTSPDEDMISSRESQQLPDPPFPPSNQSPRIRFRSIEDESTRSPALRAEVEALKLEVSNLRQSLRDQVSVFSAEKRRWEGEKQRVLQYQKFLEESNSPQEHRVSAHSTPTGSVKNITKEFTVYPHHTYSNLQYAECDVTSGTNLNLIHSEPELEV